MKFVVVGLSHKTAPVEVRERAVVPESGMAACIQRLVDRDLIESGVLLSTCNRTELYAVAPADDAPTDLFEAFGQWPHELSFETWRRHAYGLSDATAMTHLFRVAAGLESMVVGEAQILGQVKDALARSRESGVVDARLQVIMQGAIRAGKRVRHETSLGRRPVSVAHAAVASARESLGDLAGRNLLMVGAGTISQVALGLLRKRRIGHVFLTSRTRQRADRVAARLGAEAIAFEAIEDVIGSVDIMMSASSAATPLFDARQVESWQARRAGRPLLVIDLAVPRDVAPDAAHVAGVQLFDIDDLRTIAASNLANRATAIGPAEQIIAEEVDRTRQAWAARDAAPAISALVERVNGLRDAELGRHLARVPREETATRQAMQALADSLTNKFLDSEIRALRQNAD
ncbi:MAG: glutamyl-tRNA reductase [Candidatus Dormibacter sp.]